MSDNQNLRIKGINSSSLEGNLPKSEKTWGPASSMQKHNNFIEIFKISRKKK